MQCLQLSSPINYSLLCAISDAWKAEESSRPRVGDFIITNQGELKRFTYDWDASLQVTMYPDSGRGANFFLDRSGHASFSGSLAAAIPLTRIQATNEKINGAFWCFDEGIPGGGRGRMFYLKCQLFKESY